MNRLSMTAADRGSVKRAGMVVAAMLMLTASYLACMPARAKAAACTAPATDFGSASSQVSIDSAATYRVWSRVMAPDASSNSYTLKLDGNTCYTVGDSGIPANTWTWVDYQDGNTGSKIQQNLTAGTHTVEMIGREANVKLGRVLFISDLNCVPTGTGDNCATAGDTEDPKVSITAPAANATVSGTVAVKANATDNVGVQKVEFYVNGTLKSTDTSSPYEYNWDSKTSVNGDISLTAKAYDSVKSASASIQVKVANGDTAAPSVPSSVSAKADSPTKVTVSWNASTDNTAVTGYWVSRNGQSLGQVMQGTQYVDTTALPNTTYNYRVSAFDAAGNTSALSAQASVTTPNISDTQAPSAPSNVSAQVASSSQINLRWNASTDNVGVASYDVYRAVGNGTAAKVAAVNTLSYGDTGLQASTAYSYYIMARDSGGNVSDKSATISATTSAQSQPVVGRGKLYGKVTFTRNPERRARVVLTVNGVKQIHDTTRLGYYYITSIPAGTYNVSYEATGSYTKVVTLKIEAGRDTIQDVILRRR